MKPARIEPAYGSPKIPANQLDGIIRLAPTVVRDEEGIRVTRTDQVDFARAKRTTGFSYVYSFAAYEIVVGDRTFFARRYVDEWATPAILRGAATFGDVPYEDEAFSIVARYFLELADVRAVRALARGEYVTVDAERLVGAASPPHR